MPLILAACGVRNIFRYHRVSDFRAAALRGRVPRQQKRADRGESKSCTLPYINNDKNRTALSRYKHCHARSARHCQIAHNLMQGLNDEVTVLFSDEEVRYSLYHLQHTTKENATTVATCRVIEV